MGTYRCDILVVGAGPAGSSAARAAASRGLDVLVVERRETIGVPVQCAEFIPAPLLGVIGLARDFVVQSVRGMKTILPDGGTEHMRAPGFMIRRDLFDQALARAAEEEGARVLASTRVLRLEEGEVVVRSKGEAEEERVAPRVIIGADGPCSTVGRWIGSENLNLIPAVQWRVPLASPIEHTEVHFHEDFYGGYGWLFPGGREANVGLGRKQRNKHDERIGKVLERFVSRLAEEGKVEPRPLRTTAGWIPAEPARKVTEGKVLLVGEPRAFGIDRDVVVEDPFRTPLLAELVRSSAEPADVADALYDLGVTHLLWNAQEAKRIAGAEGRSAFLECDDNESQERLDRFLSEFTRTVESGAWWEISELTPR